MGITDETRLNDRMHNVTLLTLLTRNTGPARGDRLFSEGSNPRLKASFYLEGCPRTLSEGLRHSDVHLRKVLQVPVLSPFLTPLGPGRLPFSQGSGHTVWAEFPPVFDPGIKAVINPLYHHVYRAGMMRRRDMYRAGCT